LKFILFCHDFFHLLEKNGSENLLLSIEEAVSWNALELHGEISHCNGLIFVLFIVFLLSVIKEIDEVNEYGHAKEIDQDNENTEITLVDRPGFSTLCHVDADSFCLATGNCDEPWLW
jgi:hypothetical protein